MSTEPTIPAETLARFLARCRAERIAQGKAPHITTPGVYKLLDGLLLGRKASTTPDN